MCICMWCVYLSVPSRSSLICSSLFASLSLSSSPALSLSRDLGEDAFEGVNGLNNTHTHKPAHPQREREMYPLLFNLVTLSLSLSFFFLFFSLSLLSQYMFVLVCVCVCVCVFSGML